MNPGRSTTGWGLLCSRDAASLLATTIAVWLILGAAQGAQAQDMTIEQAIAMLDSRNPAEVETAIQSFGLIGSPRAVEPLAARIRRGLPPELLLAAIDTLTVLGRPEAGPILFELVAHRRPEVRLRVVQGIAACNPRGADRALISAVSDSSASVRAAAATALGELRATSAMDTLFLAWEREVPEAAVALGRIATRAEVPRILEHLGRLPFTLMRMVLAELLIRTDLAERSRLDIIARLGELATGEVRSFLEEVVASLPSGSDAIRRAAQDAMTRIAQ